MVLATVTVLVSAVVVTMGTSAPLLTRFMEDPGQVGPSFYNRVNLPIAILVAALLSAVPYLTWRGGPLRELARKMVPGLLAALVVSGVAAVLAVREPLGLAFVFLSTLALATNLHRTAQLARSGGLKASGGYLSHVGVGMILLGILASGGYDQSTKVTLEQGKPEKVDDLTLTFKRYVPRGELPEACGRKECMEVEVARADGRRYTAYPKLFVNDRTRQLMANPHVKKYLAMDLYVSPIEYDPGVPAGGSRTIRLAKEESTEVGAAEIRFLGFDLNVEGDAHAQIAAGGRVTVGAAVEVRRDGRSDVVTPVFRWIPNQPAQTPALALPGGGSIALAGLTPAEGAVFLQVAGFDGGEVVPAKLALDVTKKPLIKLVWWGLWVILAGGLFSTVHRLREARRGEEREAAPPAE
jgi:cytochrome c-type biogenesis protein CcmF